MKLVNKARLMQAALILTGSAFLAAVPAIAQDYPQQQAQQDYAPPPNFSPQQLDNLVSKIALYPDPLLAQIFAAASFPDQIQDAASWANQNRNLRGNELADAMSQANLPFDPAVQALIPFPAVLDMMARDLNWTSELGNAVLADRSAVMEAVQQMRRSAQDYGYLRSNQQMRVSDNGGAVEIEPADPSVIYVPVYDPYVVYAPPRPGYFIGGAIGFGPFYSIGVFGGWGWGGGFNWYNHAVFVNHVAWGRTWYNRDAYVHNYGNWDRGGWRNSYSNRNAGYSRGYSNAGGNYRGGQSAPVAPSQNYNRGNSGNAYYRGNQSAPVAPSQNYNRGNSGNAYYRGSQSAPVAPIQNYNCGNAGNAYYRGGQSTPVVQSRSYDRGNSGSFYRGGQSAPAVQNRGYDRGNRGGQSAPAAPSRSYDRSNGGHNDRGGRR
ncbi:MAG: DUF3300 domain-containing protein [Acidobacteriota bacterium]|nr:DUF3300 domain-containing protein [Acidobacteriota bacterium]